LLILIEKRSLTMTKQRRFRPIRGAYHNTNDNKIDRWYVNDTQSPVIDRRGLGYRTKHECEMACREVEDSLNI